VGAAAPGLGDGPAAEGDELTGADGAALADAAAVGLAAGASGLGDEAVTKVVPVFVGCLFRLRPMGTTTMPSAVTIRKLTAPHSRRKKSRFNLRPPSSPAQSVSVGVGGRDALALFVLVPHVEDADEVLGTS
jgi:hypothetical protein